MEVLGKHGIEVKSHLNALEEDQVALVKKAFAPKVEAPKAEAPKAEEAKADEAPKKKKIVALYNAQNSRGGVKPNPQKKENERRPRPQDNERRPRPQDGERRQDGERKPFNKDGQNRPEAGERKSFNRDNQNYINTIIVMWRYGNVCFYK